MIQYIRQADGTFRIEGDIHSRYCVLSILKGGEWKQPLCALPTATVQSTIEENLLTGTYLPGDIYKLEEADAKKPMSEEAKVKLKEINKEKKPTALITCAEDGCDKQFPRTRGRYPQRFCEEHRKK